MGVGLYGQAAQVLRSTGKNLSIDELSGVFENPWFIAVPDRKWNEEAGC